MKPDRSKTNSWIGQRQDDLALAFSFDHFTFRNIQSHSSFSNKQKKKSSLVLDRASCCSSQLNLGAMCVEGGRNGKENTICEILRKLSTHKKEKENFNIPKVHYR